MYVVVGAVVDVVVGVVVDVRSSGCGSRCSSGCGSRCNNSHDALGGGCAHLLLLGNSVDEEVGPHVVHVGD